VTPRPDDGLAGRERTLLVALLLSLWGPLATGLAVLLSRSSTQVADFVRRSVELVALAISWAVYRHLRRSGDLSPQRRASLERIATRGVAVALAVSGAVILLLAAGRLRSFEPGGDVRLGLLIAVLGLLTNGWFWRRFGAMARERPDALIDAQRRLYRAKVAVDACVIAALGTVLWAPGHAATRWVDLGGSVALALYLVWSAQRTLRASDRAAATAAAEVDADQPMP
jgi:divalent metal cation (Fe/Co/Zn/Cd) transporter